MLKLIKNKSKEEMVKGCITLDSCDFDHSDCWIRDVCRIDFGNCTFNDLCNEDNG